MECEPYRCKVTNQKNEVSALWLRIFHAQTIKSFAKNVTALSILPDLLFNKFAVLHLFEPACGCFLQWRDGTEHNTSRCSKGRPNYAGRANEPADTPTSSVKQLLSQKQRVRRSRVLMHFDLLPAEPTVTVRSHIPGRVAMRTCSFPSKTSASY